jgi:hypothetical protein
MKKGLFRSALLCFAIGNLVLLMSCGGGSSASTSGASGTSGGGTTGSTGPTGPNSVLNGKYAFSFTGSATSTGNSLLIAGSFTADGSGNITTGVEDLNQIGIGISKGLVITGNYTIGSDGRGTLNFTSLSQTFKIVVETGNHGQLIRFDSGAAGSGTFDLQSTSAFSLTSLHGAYVFDWNGSDSGGNPLSGIGSFNLSAGSATGAADLNDAGSYNPETVSATLQSPDANGHGTGTITYGSTALSYGYDIVSANRILLIEMDLTAATVGEADVQSATFTTSSLSGNYAFSLNGISQGFGMVGQISADGNGNIASSDVVENNTTSGVSSGSFPGTYAISNTVQGVTVNGRFLVTATEPTGFTDNFVLYMISPGQSMVMETDPDQITFGQFLTQTGAPFASSAFNGNYGLNFFGIDANGEESDFLGQITSGGTSTLTAGTLDVNDEDLSVPTVPNNAISGGSYTVANTTTGRGTITFSAANASFSFSFYFVSPSQIFMVQTDNQFFLTLGSGQSQPTIP